MVRYSFLVRLSHPLLHAGLSRRLLDHLIRRYSTVRGIVRPICLAALRLMTNSHFVAAPTGDASGWHLSEFLPLWWTARIFPEALLF